jgi:transposase
MIGHGQTTRVEEAGPGRSRSSSAARGRAVGQGVERQAGCEGTRCGDLHRVWMAATLASGRGRSPAVYGGARATLSVVGRAVGAAGAGAVAWPQCPRILHGSVDARSRRRGDLASLPRPVLAVGRVEAVGSDELEPAEARATSQRARRGPDSRLESREVAAHQKGALRRGATIVFLDESGFTQRPSVRSTWAPRGRTPVVQDRCNWQRLSAIGALAWRPSQPQTRLFLSLRPDSVKSPDVIAFLRSLRRHIRGPVVLVWDRLGAHQSKTVRDYAYSQRHWLRLEYFPPYAPELNPVEQLWANLRNQELANHTADDLNDVRRRLATGTRRLRRRDLGLGFIRHAQLISDKQLLHLRKGH